MLSRALMYYWAHRTNLAWPGYLGTGRVKMAVLSRFPGKAQYMDSKESCLFHYTLKLIKVIIKAYKEIQNYRRPANVKYKILLYVCSYLQASNIYWNWKSSC